MDDYVVRYIVFPPGVHGAVMYDNEGRPNIYLNARDPEERQKRALDHELRHIMHGDRYRQDVPIEAIERG